MVVRYIAFLRAINVGGHTVRMEELRRLFEGMGAANVQTFIASGNVIFESAAGRDVLEQRLEAGLEKALAFPVATFLRTVPEVAAIARLQVFPDADTTGAGALYVGFLKSAPAKALRAAVAAASTPAHRFAVQDREIYWLRVNLADEFVAPKLDKALGPTTFRNITTIRKIAGKFCGPALETKKPSRPNRSAN
jgi:uncharacterized protein (DUF1697 family)